jgi:hypothetical protein
LVFRTQEQQAPSVDFHPPHLHLPLQHHGVYPHPALGL